LSSISRKFSGSFKPNKVGYISSSTAVRKMILHE
jgi:hypothetical protein